MRTSIAVATVCACLVTGAARAGEPAKKPEARPAMAKAEMKDAKGVSLGTMTFEQTPHGVLIKADLKGLPAGTHALHVHEIGKCDPPFKTAGGHFNPTHKEHGLKNVKGMHAGDMPNVEVPASGEAHVEVLNPNISLAPGLGDLLDADGSAVVLHAGVDDYASNPAGNAGDRIACGVVQR